MSQVYPISNFPEYQNQYVSRRMRQVVERDGLIEPLLLISETEVHPISQERFKAFKDIAESLGDYGAKTIIGVLVTNLSQQELEEIL